MLCKLKGALKTILSKQGYGISKINCLNSPYHQLLKALKHFKIDSIIDVGSNVGQFSKAVIKEGFVGDILSVEPLESAHQTLLAQAKKYPNWKVAPPMALSHQIGEAQINVCSRSSCSSLLPMLECHQIALPSATNTHQEIIKTQTLDGLIDDFPEHISNKKYLVKIDVQGLEWEVLQGGQQCIDGATAIFCEASLTPLFQNQKLWIEIINYLQGKGFKIWSIQKAFVNEKTGQDLQLNILFIKDDIKS
jgi:FkbM family methyltransferase